jgi:putative oxidoreductase
MKVIYFVGRLIVGAYYLYNGIHHFSSFSALVQYAKFKGVLYPEVAVSVAGVLLLIAGITLLIGYHPEIGVAALVLFLVPVTLKMHNFWAETADQRMADLVNFLKNWALLGSALLFLQIPRPWPLSLSKKR